MSYQILFSHLTQVNAEATTLSIFGILDIYLSSNSAGRIPCLCQDLGTTQVFGGSRYFKVVMFQVISYTIKYANIVANGNEATQKISKQPTRRHELT